MLCVDHDFLSSFGFEIAEGRTFNLDIWSDSNAFILNEAAVKKYQIDRPIGKDVIFNYAVKQPKKGKIIGVVKDFHYASLHSEVEPLMIQIFPPFFRYVILKVETGSPTTLIAEIERKWHKHLPHAPFRYNYLDQTYDEIYSADNRLGRIFYFFTVVALFLAALGLYGLVAFISEQRKAEIGIRKILGASIGRLMFTMSREFVLLIFISNVIAWIPAWFFIKSWLSDFVFRIEPSIWPFVYTSFISLFIGLITISIKTWLTSKSNPADILSNQ
jgi:putative ABC transport system permease protein